MRPHAERDPDKRQHQGLGYARGPFLMLHPLPNGCRHMNDRLQNQQNCPAKANQL